MIPLLFKYEFSPYAVIPVTVDVDSLNTAIVSSQNAIIRPLLGKDLYDLVYAEWIVEYEVSSYSVGVNTNITLTDASALSIGEFVLVSGLSGDTNEVFAERVEITNKAGNVITVNVNTTGLTLSGGVVTNRLQSDYEILRTQFLPLFVYDTYLRYLPESNQFNTRAGNKYKKDDISERVDNERLGAQMDAIKQDRDVWIRRVREWLYDNRATYPDYIVPSQDDNRNVNIPIKPRRNFWRNNIIKY